MMTGVSPLEHRSSTSRASTPATGTKEPITSDERREPALWNMASLGGPAGASVRAVGHVPRRGGQRHRSSRIGCSASCTRRTSRRPASSSPQAREAAALETLRSGRGRRRARRAARVPALARRGGVPAALEDSAESLRPPGERAASDPGRDRASTTSLATECARAASGPTSPSSTSRAPTASGTSSRPSRRPGSPRSSEEDFERYQGSPSATSGTSTSCSARYRALAEQRGAVLMLASDHGFSGTEGRPTQLLELRPGDGREVAPQGGDLPAVGAGHRGVGLTAHPHRGGVSPRCARRCWRCWACLRQAARPGRPAGSRCPDARRRRPRRLPRRTTGRPRPSPRAAPAERTPRRSRS